MDLKIRFGVKFCSRYTFPEVCATKMIFLVGLQEKAPQPPVTLLWIYWYRIEYSNENKGETRPKRIRNLLSVVIWAQANLAEAILAFQLGSKQNPCPIKKTS